MPRLRAHATTSQWSLPLRLRSGLLSIRGESASFISAQDAALQDLGQGPTRPTPASSHREIRGRNGGGQERVGPALRPHPGGIDFAVNVDDTAGIWPHEDAYVVMIRQAGRRRRQRLAPTGQLRRHAYWSSV